jgi:hypothetical protein
MSEALRYLPFELPSHLGSCTAVRAPMGDKSVILMQLATSGHGRYERVAGDCLRWLLSHYRLPHAATDNVADGSRLCLHGPHFVLDSPGRPPTQLRGTPFSDPDPWAAALKNRDFEMVIHGCDSPAERAAQTTAFTSHYKLRANLVAEAERLWRALLDLARQEWHPACGKILDVAAESDDFGDIRGFNSLADSAAELGLDLEPFPTIDFFHKNQASSILWQLQLSKSDAAIPALLSKLAARLSPDLGRDLDIIWQRLQPAEAGTADTAEGGKEIANLFKRVAFFDSLREICLQNNLPADQTSDLREVFEISAQLHPLLALEQSSGRLASETRGLFRLVALQSQSGSAGSSKRTEAAARLFDLADCFGLLRKLLFLSVTNADFREILLRLDKDALLADLGHFGLHWNGPIAYLSKGIAAGKQYYHSATLRGRFMGSRIRNLLDEPRNAAIPLLVTATGFLTDHICQALDSAATTIYTIRPNIGKELENNARAQRADLQSFYQRLYRCSSVAHHSA